MREDCAAFARYWQAHNDQVLAMNGPLWVVLGDEHAGMRPCHRSARKRLESPPGGRYTRGMTAMVRLLLVAPR